MSNKFTARRNNARRPPICKKPPPPPPPSNLPWPPDRITLVAYVTYGWYGYFTTITMTVECYPDDTGFYFTGYTRTAQYEAWAYFALNDEPAGLALTIEGTIYDYAWFRVQGADWEIELPWNDPIEIPVHHLENVERATLYATPHGE